MDFSNDTNANWTDISKGSARICSGSPENAGQRQGLAAFPTVAACSGCPENAGQRQVHSYNASWAASSGFPENAGQRQELRAGRCGKDRSGCPENAGQRQVRRYTFKLYPNRAQEAALRRQAALLAHLWNAALEQREIQWAHECQRKAKGERKGLSYFDQARELKHVRATDPEFATMSASSLELCLRALDDAFKAFFKRAKGGAGKSSGYPRYKSPFAIENKEADCTIWHRDHRKGWRLDKAGKHFKVYAKGIPGMIKARGKFPVPVEEVELRDMRLIRVSGEWLCSIVVRIEARRVPGSRAIGVEFDLIDEFARVEIRANGECLPGWAEDFSSSNEQISPESQGVIEASAADGLETGADGRFSLGSRKPPLAADGLEAGADGRLIGQPGRGDAAADGLEAGADGRQTRSGKAERPAADGLGTDDIQSIRDMRRKKFSYRWRQETRRIAKRKAKEARQRKEALHRWTTALVREASELTVICPPIKANTTSAKGNEKNPGAAVKPVAALNRHVLAQAPAMAIQMFEYKAAEAGIPFARLTPDEHALQIGRDLPKATKAVRRLRRELNRGKEVA